MIFQSYAIWPNMTVYQNVAFGLELRRLPAADIRKRVAQMLDVVQLGAQAERYPAELSGGQQQRVALARAVVVEPEVLLLDEPLSNLDAKLREEMQIELRQIQRNVGTTTILVTHDQSEAMALSDRIAVMSQGRIEQIAPPHEAYERPATPFVANFLGKTNVLETSAQTDANGAHVTLGDGRWPAPAGSPPRVLVTVRPEKIRFANGGDPALAGTVATRIFQGNHWLYQIDTAHGRVTVIRQNSGEPAPGEGESVRLTWQHEDMSVRPAGGGP